MANEDVHKCIASTKDSVQNNRTGAAILEINWNVEGKVS